MSTDLPRWALVSPILLSTAFGPLLSSIPAAQAQNVFQSDQETYGNWQPTKYIQNGWSGYHVVSRFTKGKRWVKYKSGDDSYYLPDQCPDGDCQYTEDTVIYRVGQSGFQGMRAMPGKPIGKIRAYDGGSVEERTVMNNAGVAIAKINETEGQSRMRFHESQVTTLMTFDSTGTRSFEVGHIEEADAPNMVNQPESVYRRVNDQDQFVATVVERIGFSAGNESEYFRLGTEWCMSDAWKNETNIVKKLFRRDFIDLPGCEAAGMPIKSVFPGGFNAFGQLFTGRGNAFVTTQDPDRRGTSFKYEVGVDRSFGVLGTGIGANGTDYFIRDPRNGKFLAFINSEMYQSMGNGGKWNDPWDPGVNFPKAKMISANWGGASNFKGIGKGSWTNPGLSSAVALVAYEKYGERYSNLKGQSCTTDKWGKTKDPSGRVIYDNETEARRCKVATTYTLHYYILFPPKVRGKEMGAYEKLSNVDRLLAMMPDQAQSSPELTIGEEYIDEIRALERYNASLDPAAIDFDLMIDINTEEDHTRAQSKIWSMLSDLGVVQPAQNVVRDEQLPAEGKFTPSRDRSHEQHIDL